ncbi:MAG: CBS domain-containing protein [Clostridiales bacterium]|nr:CBS domain-containing protein [Clostridiales bacterium]
MNSKAKDIMNSNVISAKVGETLKQALMKLIENDINALPVLDDADNLVGMLSETDIIDYSGKTHVTTSLDTKKWVSPYEKTWEKFGYQLGAENLDKAYVETVMSKKVTTTKEDASVIDVAKLMTKKKINHVPVLDQNDKLSGIIARGDIIRYLAKFE